jgi:predicted phage terminase large subunit-like protein
MTATMDGVDLQSIRDRAVIAEDRPSAKLTTDEQERFAELTQRLLTIPYCPWTPNAGPQTLFLLDQSRESLYGGAAGGGKSIGLLMAASMNLYVPGYSALLLRKTFADLGRPLALMDLAEQWWGGVPGVKYDAQKHTYTFDCPGGGHSRIEFGGLDSVNDKLKYQGGGYNFVGFDELTQFRESDYTYLFSRMRRQSYAAIARIPIRMRAATNPGGPGHEWVYRRFIANWLAWQKGLAQPPKRRFHPALLTDNPGLDWEDYVGSMMELDPITRAQLLRGDWNIRPDGRMFSRKWFTPITRDAVPGNCVWVRFWDMAAAEPTPGHDPDYFVGALLGRSPDGRTFISDIRRWREEPGMSDLRCKATVLHDTGRVTQVMEKDPGAAGKIAIRHFRNGPFATATFHSVDSTGKSRGRTTTIQAGKNTPTSKIIAAGPLASHANAGEVFVVIDGSWDHEAFLSEIEIFPDGEHDDQADAVSGAYNYLAGHDLAVPSSMADGEEQLEQQNYWAPSPMSWGFDTAGGYEGERISRAVANVTQEAARAATGRVMAETMAAFDV